MSRPSQPLRLLLAVVMVLLVAMLLLTLLRTTETALSVWTRLQDWPAWVSTGFLLVLTLLIALAGWGLWRLLRPSRPRSAKVARIERDTLEQRIAQLEGSQPEAVEAREVLEELDRRQQEKTVQVCLFGHISTGKSSLLQALAPEALPAINVIGGSTHSALRYRGQLPDGSVLDITDVPGSAEAGDTEHLALAHAEAAQAHALIYVVDGDLSRSQAQELSALAAFSRPILLVLNKMDRFNTAQQHALMTRLREQAAPLRAQVIAVSAAHDEEILREGPNGEQEWFQRHCPANVVSLQRALMRLARTDVKTLEAGREAALFSHVDVRLSAGEQRIRQERSQVTIQKYTRRAVVGALAAIAPGTDLVIQGALATALTRELCQIHGLRPRDVDIDALLARAGGLMRTGSSITLAVVGNALKAFPGMGTVSGGVVHAVAYGLIFDSLGRALADTLAHTHSLDRDATLAAFQQQLGQLSRERLMMLARLAFEENTTSTSRASSEDTP